uniref:7-carboxy-7-deazaguanine synthase n=1 Tax=Candidatus Kentrum sp. LFY TaxID=2126342 RepID=A0A450WZ21_9GAMM|nr:MAG: Organic radical activating enzyme [Candidatus Kentron sp. LFY]
MQASLSDKTYRINEIFLSAQGEGKRQGDLSVFVRFTGCNLRCDIDPGPRSPGGFACDTEFVSGMRMYRRDILNRGETLWKTRSPKNPLLEIQASKTSCPKISCPKWMVFTGGEPMLQLDHGLVTLLHDHHWLIQIETNGTRRIPEEWKIDWITVSPKVAEHALQQTLAHEVKYVRGYGQALPRTRVQARHRFISPAFDGTELDGETLQWCRGLVDGSDWELSVQMHKIWNIR